MGRKKASPPPDGEPKSMKELTKGFEEFMHEKIDGKRLFRKKDQANENAEADFENLLGKAVRKRDH